MQFLPVPLLVLSSLKTVVLANEAMGRLLGMVPESAEEQNVAAIMNGLLGQSLSQVGIDMAEEGRPFWGDWEQFLDSLIKKAGTRRTPALSRDANGPRLEFDSTTTTEGPDSLPSCSASQQSSQNAVMEVIISRKDLSRTAFGSRVYPSTQLCASMIVNVWELDEHQTYFTLTFGINNSELAPLLLPRSSNAGLPDVGRQASTKPEPAPAFPTHTPNSPPYILTSAPVSLMSSPSLPQETRFKSSIPSEPSILQKITMMKDALFESTQFPVLAMWKDGTVAFPNKAARKLFDKPLDADRFTDGFDMLSAWTFWSDDFSRKLDIDENPMSILLRTETPFASYRVGMYDDEGNKHNYEVVGEVVRDDVTGEFLAGVITAKDVTNVTEMITQIKEQDNERFRLICDTMPQLVWTATPDGLHDFYNTRWYNYTGLTESSTLGLGWRKAFHPDDLEESERLWKHSLRTGEPYITEYRCRSKEGEWKWFIGRALPLRSKQTGEIEQWFGTCTEANESIEARLMAKQTRQQLLSVIAHSHVTIFTVDVNRRVTMLEGALIWDTLGDASLNGEEPPWYIGENVYEVFNRLNSQLPQGQRPQFLEPIESIIAGQPAQDLKYHEIDGHYYRTRFIPVFDDKDERPDHSSPEGVIGVILDVTEMKMKEVNIEAQEREKQRLVANEAAAKEASRLKSQFLANMSHEIRTPITGVLGMAELLLDLDLGEEQRDYTENIYRSASALLTVINDILDLSKVESGRLDIEEVQFSLSVIVNDVNKMLGFAAERKNLDFISDIPWDIENDLVVLGDPGRVRQIITNILTNSIKFTNQGHVKFSVSKEMETADMIEVKFVVEDTGIGIEEDVHRRLFQPFSQGDASTARKFGGTGLGLAICKNLLELMRGRITLGSTMGAGTTATFWIPFNKLQESNPAHLVRIGPLPPRLQSDLSVSCNSSEIDHFIGGMSLVEPTGNAKIEKRSLRKKSITALAPGLLSEEDLSPLDRAQISILVVEDNAINQHIATKTIRKLGFNVSAAWNGREALDYLKAAKEGKHRKPDIILMDVQMPVIDGYKCTHLLRHHLPYKTYISNVPIVAMTASAIQGDKEKCRKAGMDDYLAKPVKRKALERMLIRWSTTKRRSSLSPITTPEALSDCSETSEQCANADIPGIGHDDFGFAPPLKPRDSDSNSHQHSPAASRHLSRSEAASGSTLVAADSPSGLGSVQPVGFPGTDELAMQSRQDKLIDLAGPSSSSVASAAQHGHQPLPHLLPPLLPVGAALTEENVEKLQKEASKRHV